jgi:hypothetical protein
LAEGIVRVEKDHPLVVEALERIIPASGDSQMW